MSNQLDKPLQFKFQWLDEKGNATGFLRKRGRFNGELLVLDDVEIPAGVMTHVEVRDAQMVFAVLTESGEPAVLGVSLTNRAAQDLKRAIDVARSGAWAGFHRERLQQEGREAAYRDEECPHCRATLILSDMPQTPQLYCHFCNTLMTLDGMIDPPAGERDLKVCDECEMFSKPRKFTVFYFVFLVFFIYSSQRSTWRCPACMRGDAWKMLLGNLPFLLGVPVALTQLARSYGGSVIGGPFKGLDAANLKARRGNLMGALEGYRAILDCVPHSAGIKYNLGRALLEQGETARAAESLRLALDDCSNYAPAYRLLSACYEQLGEQAKLAELRRVWDDDAEEEDVENLEEAELD